MSATDVKGKREAPSSKRFDEGFGPATQIGMASHGRKKPASPNLGLRIAYRRMRLGLTQEQLGDLVGVTGSNISHWENARFVTPTEVIPALATALRTKSGWLMGEHVTDEEMEEREAAILRLVVQGGERLDLLLGRLKSVDDLVDALERYFDDPTKTP